MLKHLLSNPKTTIWGILALTAEALRQSPDLISFLPDGVEGYILGFATLICSIMAILNMQDKLTPSEIELKEVKKEQEKQELKTEIKQETAGLVEEAKNLIDEKVIQPPQSPESLVVKEIITEAITITEKEKE